MTKKNTQNLAPSCLTVNQRLVEPGWGGELGPDELDFLQAELTTKKKLAYQWGFQPAKKRRPEWAIRQVAMLVDPGNRGVNMGLARRQIPGNSALNPDFHAQTQMARRAEH